MTNYGFCGPMSDMSTVFTDKAAAEVIVGGMRYRYGYRYDWISSLLLMWGVS